MSFYDCIEPEFGRERLRDYLAKNLDKDQERLFEAHIQACRYCHEVTERFDLICRLLAEELALRESKK